MSTHRFERVTGHRDLRQFLAFADRLYADEPRHVPVPRRQIRRWWRDGVPLYLLRDAAGTVVARTTLHTDPAFDAKIGRRCQLFGLTEFTASAARPLFDALNAYADADRDLLFGPVALLPNQAGGVITSGYPERGFVDSAWNPPRYVAAYEEYGFHRRFESDTWICPVTAPTRPVPAPTRIEPDGARLELHRGDVGRLDEQLDLLRGMLNAAFAQLGYYTPISAEQLRRQTDGLAYLLDESLLLYLTRDGQPVAFVLCVPDISEFLVAVRGDLHLVNQLRLLATRHRYRREAVLIVKGVLPRYQGRGYQRLLSAHLHRNLHIAGYTTLRSTYVGRDNPASAAQYRRLGGRPLHGYTFYAKER
ncbi:GNAT family N-acetyltransferase [Micromonospora andamanensis]|uniref:N-acetyltransferase domain-containing protein n=1 Tax=Micromonospora andamanensis TaxID=1287068 RepID=A0ABQ4HZB4_9ACTN|nr:hypothetical protein [Micromonospora andamanensis]GIJ11004.1 hypothetical protein Van01_42180 [Micromonospora andamanensis]